MNLTTQCSWVGVADPEDGHLLVTRRHDGNPLDGICERCQKLAEAMGLFPAIRHAAEVSSELEDVHACLDLVFGAEEGRRIYMLGLAESRKTPAPAVKFVRDFAQRHIDAALKGGRK